MQACDRRAAPRFRIAIPLHFQLAKSSEPECAAETLVLLPGERGELYYVDLGTGKPAVLVAAEKLATLEPPPSKIRDERKTERRHTIGGYHWAPDSQHLLDSPRQLRRLSPVQFS